MALKKIKLFNEMVFNSDDEFYEFCVDPKLLVKEYTDKNGDTRYYTDFEFTNAYKDAINKKTIFYINNPNSSILKRGCVSYRTITKPVENIFEYPRLYARSRQKNNRE